MYTDIPKPGAQTYTNLNKDLVSLPEYGTAIYGTSKYGQVNTYTSIAKPTTQTYTNIPKPV